MTHYFYWYDSASGSHFHEPGRQRRTDDSSRGDERLLLQAAKLAQAQLEDMMAAGIDVVLPVYWGAPSEQNPGSHHHWSFEGPGAVGRGHGRAGAGG